LHQLYLTESSNFSTTPAQEDFLGVSAKLSIPFRSLSLIGNDYTFLKIKPTTNFVRADFYSSVSMDLTRTSDVPRRNYGKTSGFEDAF